jgi:hypothetical protein
MRSDTPDPTESNAAVGSTDETLTGFSMLGNELLGNAHLRRAVRSGLAYAATDPFSRSESRLREFEESLGQFKGVIDSFIRRSRVSPAWVEVMHAAHRVLSELSLRHSGHVQAESFMTGLKRMVEQLQEAMDDDDNDEARAFFAEIQSQGLPNSSEVVGGAAESLVNLTWNFLYALAAIAPLESFLREE